MTTELKERVLTTLRDIPDFPKPGILFKDLTPVLADPVLFGDIVKWMATRVPDADVILAIEARGFPFGAAMVEPMGVGLAIARKPGKLPWTTIQADYELEYGTASLQVHADAVQPGQRVLIVDDLLATGGTVRAAIELVERLGGVVAGVVVLTELGFLKGVETFDAELHALVTL